MGESRDTLVFSQSHRGCKVFQGGRPPLKSECRYNCISRHEQAGNAIVVGQRRLMARFWRQGRDEYIALSANARAACKGEWDAWRGPRTPTNLIYVVQKYNGVGDARADKMRAEIRASNARIEARLLAQPALV